MNGNRQIEIPPAVPGEPIGQTLLNSLIGAANNARQITGDGGLNVSNIGGVIGLSLDTKQPARQQFLIQVQASPTLAPGFYYGKVYSQTAIPFISSVAGSSTTPLMPVAIPNAVTCLVVNIAEVNAALYGTAGTYTAAPRQITVNRMAFGQFVGYMDSTNIVPALPAGPLFAVDVGTIGGTVLFKPAGSLTLDGSGTLSGGIYSGRPCSAVSSVTNITASTYSLATIASDGGSSNSYCTNLIEMGQTTHDLLSTTNTASLILAIDKGQTVGGVAMYQGILTFPGCS